MEPVGIYTTFVSEYKPWLVSIFSEILVYLGYTSTSNGNILFIVINYELHRYRMLKII